MTATTSVATEPVVKTCTCCKKTFTMAQWNALYLCGHGDRYEDGDERNEMRNCYCRSSIVIDRSPAQRLANT